MRLASFKHDKGVGYGLVDRDEVSVLDVRTPGAPASLRVALGMGPAGLQAIRELSRSAPRASLEEVHLLPPIADPTKYMCLGGNYASHLEEAEAQGHRLRSVGQTWFNKQVGCVNGPYDPIHRPRISTLLDYEGEMGLVIGRRCRNVPRDAWREVVAGYVVCNDVSVRDWQLRAPTHTLGKSFDTHGPFGPFLVTIDEVEDPFSLRLRTLVNGEVRQSATTGDMIHKFGEQLEELTSAVTLEPGDVLATGSPAGVGGLMTPPRYLVAGDVVRVEIEQLGHIENRVIEEPEPLQPFSPSAQPLF